MRASLIRIGIDQTYGEWNAPANPENGQFVYVPIPENSNVKLHPKFCRTFESVIERLEMFCQQNHCDLSEDLNFPSELINQPMHLDPDFQTLTYGDNGAKRGKKIATFSKDDLLVFYSGLNPVKPYLHKLYYAIVGLFVIDEVVSIQDIPKNRWHENAHTRKMNFGETDIIIRAQPNISGKLEKCIPIGEWRNRAYRVQNELLQKWGDLDNKDGFIQRSGTLPLFLNPEAFYLWFIKQNIRLIKEN